MSTPRERIDQVLAGVEQALSQPGVRWAGAEHVRRALGWPEERLQEVKDLMAQLVEAGDLRGPRSGPLRDGSGRVVDVDVPAITPQGRRRLERARRPLPRRAWDAAGLRTLRAGWQLVAGIVIGVAASLLALYLAKQLGWQK